MFVGSEPLDLRLVLIDSAQCFHWTELSDGSFAGAVNGVPVRLWREDDGIHAEGDMDVASLRRYLDLDRDYAGVAAEYAHIPAARRAIELYPGMRVLNQPAWEALIAFILSANNNVSRIRKLVTDISAAFGPQFEVNGREIYGFPSPIVLAECDEDELRALGAGYRAPFLIGTALAVCDGFPLNDLRDMDYEEAHELLTMLPGVGDKVADCVLLFGCGHASAFPVDVWVERLLKSWFGIECKDRTKMMRIARKQLGAHAGLLQQFLFHAARMGEPYLRSVANGESSATDFAESCALISC